mmetsp:Transcript_5271/g.10724  ORF Transcript_5271/g.10724 Transcript_5271/m.10724 type:complete len:217 (-) Transcript_5271:34-684(-)
MVLIVGFLWFLLYDFEGGSVEVYGCRFGFGVLVLRYAGVVFDGVDGMCSPIAALSHALYLFSQPWTSSFQQDRITLDEMGVCVGVGILDVAAVVSMDMGTVGIFVPTVEDDIVGGRRQAAHNGVLWHQRTQLREVVLVHFLLHFLSTLFQPKGGGLSTREYAVALHQGAAFGGLVFRQHVHVHEFELVRRQRFRLGGEKFDEASEQHHDLPPQINK